MQMSELKDLPVEFQELPGECQEAVLQFIDDNIKAAYKEIRAYHCKAVIREGNLEIDDDDEYGEGDPVFQHYECNCTAKQENMTYYPCMEWVGQDEYDMIRHAMRHLGFLEDSDEKA